MTIQNYSNTKEEMVIDPYNGVIEQPVIIPVSTASPQPSKYTNQLPPFPPKDSNDRRCIALTCGWSICAIVSCMCIVFVLPIIIWLIVASQMESGYDDAVNAQKAAFNQFNNGDDLSNINSNTFDDAFFSGGTNGFGN
jgi:hypothetical protein